MQHSKLFAAFLISILVMLTAAGCLSPGTGLGNDLAGTAWQLDRYDSVPLLEGTEFTARFEQTELQGNAGCNHYFASYQVKGDRITITGLGWTEMACLQPEGVMEQEQIILNLMGEAADWELKSGQLLITTADGSRLVFTESGQP